jgi:Gpi18-like mannosyltransferase
MCMCVLRCDGIGVALVHRLILGVWMALVWLAISPFTDYPPDFEATTEGHLPDLGSPAARIVFGVWRRWDAVHYLDLAEHGYRAGNPGPTVFGPLPPYSFRAAGWLLPGPADVGAMAVQTGALALALVLLFRLVEVDYGDPKLARWSVVITALLPLSYFYAAPMSESLYLALALGLVCASFRRRWGWAALCGVLATLARTQGVMLAGGRGFCRNKSGCPQ